MQMRPVGLLVLLTLSLSVIPLAARAPQVRPVPKIGMLMLGSPPASPDWKERSPFLQELRSLGWREGQNVAVEYRWAQGAYSHLYDLASELVQLQVDVIVASATPALRAAKQATSTIPIVMLYVDDPVAEGIVASLAQPGGNITGVGGFVSELSGKWLELLKEAVPEVTHIAVLVQPMNPMTAFMVRDVESAARTLGVQLHVVEVWQSGGFERAFDTAIRQGAGALLVLPAILFASHQKRIAALAAKSRLPAIYWQRPFVERGGLMSYGPRMSDLWRRVAALVDKILKGTPPADLPVEQPMNYELVLNLKTAKALGITIPPLLRFQANEVIQ
jgi:putative tryptophan/tyrosine transport system substrate-binding protein